MVEEVGGVDFQSCLFKLMFSSGFEEFDKDAVGFEGPGFVFGVALGAQEKRMDSTGQFDELDQVFFDGATGNDQAGFF